MSKEVQKRTKTPADKKAIAASTPALLAALSLLSASLGVASATPLEDSSNTPSAGTNIAGMKLAKMQSNQIKQSNRIKQSNQIKRSGKATPKDISITKENDKASPK